MQVFFAAVCRWSASICLLKGTWKSEAQVFLWKTVGNGSLPPCKEGKLPISLTNYPLVHPAVVEVLGLHVRELAGGWTNHILLPGSPCIGVSFLSDFRVKINRLFGGLAQLVMQDQNLLKSWPAGSRSEQQPKSTGFGMPAVKMSSLPRAVGICPGDEVKRSNIQRELGVESLHFLGIDRSKAMRFRHLISMHPDQQPLQGVLGTSVRTESPWVWTGPAGGITNPVLPESA